MPIPGLKLSYEVRGKVKIGEKGERGAKSLDYFISDDPEVPSNTSTLSIVLPHADVDDNFNTGLEWWVKTRQGGQNQLACYTKGSGEALRLPPYVSEENDVVGEPRGGQGRIPIVCPFRSCPQFKQEKGGCKPMGRLVFFIEGGRTDSVLELATKSWNSIERLTAALTGARTRGPLTGRQFTLSVAYESKGNKRFPVLSIQECGVDINNDKDAGYADALIAYEQTFQMGPREQLAAMLDHTNPGWRDNPAFIERIKEVGPDAALATLLDKVNTAVNG